MIHPRELRLLTIALSPHIGPLVIIIYHAHQQTSVKSCPKQLIDCFDEDGGIDLARLVEYRRSKCKQFYQGLQDIKGVKLHVLHQMSNADMYRHVLSLIQEEGGHVKRGKLC